MIDFPATGPPAGPARHGSEPPPSPSGSPPASSGPPLSNRELARMGDEIARLSAHLHAGSYRVLALIGAFDQAQGWHRQGFKSCARWLSWRTGIAPGAARERVRVARALTHLPHLSQALRTGQMSYSAARALTRIATPENEEELVQTARHTTAAQLERLVRAWRAADRAEAQERERARGGHPRPELWLLPEPDGSWTLHGRLDPETGALLRRALAAATEQLYRKEKEAEGAEEPETGSAERPQPETPRPEVPRPAERPPAATRRAEAFGLIVQTDLGGGLGGDATRRADRFQVLLHVSAETLSGENGNGRAGNGAGPGARHEPPRLEPGGRGVSAETARRIACDAGVVRITHDREGHLLDVGRKSRAVPPVLRRALEARDDARCRFPGCDSRYCDAHHLTHWARGGETKLDNLILLCRYHHRLVHEEGWRVVGVKGGKDRGGGAADGATNGGATAGRATAGRATRFRFYRPDGRELPAVPPVPTLPADPVAALEREQRGLEIGPETPATLWMGDRLDTDWALFTLRRPARAEIGDGAGDEAAEAQAPDASADTQAPGVSAETSEPVSAETPGSRTAEPDRGGAPAAVVSTARHRPPPGEGAHPSS